MPPGVAFVRGAPASTGVNWFEIPATEQHVGCELRVVIAESAPARGDRYIDGQNAIGIQCEKAFEPELQFVSFARSRCGAPFRCTSPFASRTLRQHVLLHENADPQ